MPFCALPLSSGIPFSVALSLLLVRECRNPPLENHGQQLKSGDFGEVEARQLI
jgi:hypothetical protein